MAKASGNTRIVKPFPFSEQTLEAYYNDRVKAINGDSDRSYIDKNTNAFLIQVTGRKPDENEKLVADHLVAAGISVELTPEGITTYATAFKPDGTPKFSDGRAALYTYEQKTVSNDATNIVGNFRNAIGHAVDKGADIALIFDRYGLGHREQVEQAMQEYQLPRWGRMPKAVIVINKDGEVFEHHF